LARGAYKVLYLAGYRNMLILDEGIPGWVQKRYPVEPAVDGGRVPIGETAMDLRSGGFAGARDSRGRGSEGDAAPLRVT